MPLPGPGTQPIVSITQQQSVVDCIEATLRFCSAAAAAAAAAATAAAAAAKLIYKSGPGGGGGTHQRTNKTICLVRNLSNTEKSSKPPAARQQPITALARSLSSPPDDDDRRARRGARANDPRHSFVIVLSIAAAPAAAVVFTPRNRDAAAVWHRDRKVARLSRESLSLAGAAAATASAARRGVQGRSHVDGGGEGGSDRYVQVTSRPPTAPDADLPTAGPQWRVGSLAARRRRHDVDTTPTRRIDVISAPQKKHTHTLHQNGRTHKRNLIV